MNKGVPRNFQKTFFSDSGATPFFLEQFAAMPRTSMCLKKWGTERSEVSNGRGVQTPGVLPWKLKKKPTLWIGSCNQNYSGALLVNKISLVFLQSIKEILTLFFMPTIKILMQIYAIQADLVLVYPGY